ncbi:hypothetical protein N0V86_001521 [Didymella sp. IMI 355093]|nr:hypothetical protein N0V86_001521 [Didymella sp. IMI 355093]
MSDWNDHELLVYILTAMEFSNVKPDYNNAPVPAGRTGSGCAQKIMKLKKALRGEMDALKNGSPVNDAKAKGRTDGDGTPKATPKKATTPRKRKGKSEGGAVEGGEGSPTKKGRGRSKKAAAAPPAEDDEAVKNEVKEEAEAEV